MDLDVEVLGMASDWRELPEEQQIKLPGGRLVAVGYKDGLRRIRVTDEDGKEMSAPLCEHGDSLKPNVLRRVNSLFKGGV